MAVLYRINSRSEDLEEALSRAGIPFQVRGGAFLARPAARQAFRLLGRPGGTGVATAVREVAARLGLAEGVATGLGDEELTRQTDLARLVRLAEEFDDESRTVADFLADLEARFGAERQGRGVNLLTYHRAKGLEFEAVFLPRLEEGELPFGRSPTSEAVAEERRLLYVGLTRAKRVLHLGWVVGQKPSRFLRELGAGVAGPPPAHERSERDRSPAFGALKSWRRDRAKADGVPAYVVFHDSTLEEIAQRAPGTVAELAAVPGVGPTKLERYGPDVIAVLERTG
jgi:DNA helicase II / ATP-dependent DNA helicase PcrA